MRILIVMPLLALGACNVSTDQNNQSVTVQYNQEEAQNTAADISNTAQNVGEEIGNEATTAANAINQKVGSDNSSDNSTNTTNQETARGVGTLARNWRARGHRSQLWAGGAWAGLSLEI